MDIPLEALSLREAYRQTGGDSPPHEIPWIVRFMENPASPLSFPGQIDLREHDYLHILLGLDRSPESEAFLVGFCMGLDPRTTLFHLTIFKIISRFLYPKSYRFSSMDIATFERGYLVGKNPRYDFIDHLDFTPYLDMRVSEIGQKTSLYPIKQPAICTPQMSIENSMPIHTRSP